MNLRNPATYGVTYYVNDEGRLPGSVESQNTDFGSRFIEESDYGREKSLLVFIRGECSEHHLPPSSSHRVAVGFARFGLNNTDFIESTVLDSPPTNQKAVLEAIVRTLEKKFYLESFNQIDFALCDEYVVNGMLFGFEVWNNQNWILPIRPGQGRPAGQERPNKRYWLRIKELAEDYERAGCKIRVWSAEKEYISRFCQDFE